MDINATLEMVAGLLRAMGVVGTIAMGPAAGGALSALASVATLASTLLQQGEAGAAQLGDLTKELEKMVAAGRNPTESEWAGLRKRSDSAHSVIQAAAAGKT